MQHNKKIKIRNCPFCEATNNYTLGVPYKTYFENQFYYYIKCSQCKIVYVNPVPNEKTLKNIYSTNNYHKKYYTNNYNEYKFHYIHIYKDILKFLNQNSKFLDYGCGIGYFLKFLNENNIYAEGVEFDINTVIEAKKNSTLNTMLVKKFNTTKNKYDFIYLGDVFEHLSEPIEIVKSLSERINKGGYICIEGPLERNMSFSNYCVIFNSFIKNKFLSSKNSFHPPLHLIFFGLAQQIRFFNKFNNLKLVKYTLYETGWPLINGNIFKNFLGAVSKLLSILPFFKLFYGNRIRIFLIKK